MTPCKTDADDHSMRGGKKRLTRELWLSAALEHLAQTGSAGFTIDRLVQALGVTKGSFYWHFQDRREFFLNVFDFWDRQFTQVVVQRVDALAGSPVEKLWKIVESVWQEDLARYDIAVRAWAMRERAVAERVREVDMKRLRTVRRLFSEIGFQGVALEMRTRCFATYLSMDSGITVEQAKKRRGDCLREFHALITDRSRSS